MRAVSWEGASAIPHGMARRNFCSAPPVSRFNASRRSRSLHAPPTDQPLTESPLIEHVSVYTRAESAECKELQS